MHFYNRTTSNLRHPVLEKTYYFTHEAAINSVSSYFSATMVLKYRDNEDQNQANGTQASGVRPTIFALLMTRDHLTNLENSKVGLIIDQETKQILKSGLFSASIWAPKQSNCWWGSTGDKQGMKLYSPLDYSSQPQPTNIGLQYDTLDKTIFSNHKLTDRNSKFGFTSVQYDQEFQLILLAGAVAASNQPSTSGIGYHPYVVFTSPNAGTVSECTVLLNHNPGDTTSQPPFYGVDKIIK